METSTRNEVANNKAGGDIAGGDINKSQHYHLPQLVKKNTLRSCLEKIKGDCVIDPNFGICISRLNHYLNSIHPDQQRDLTTKLRESGREDEIEQAVDLKERFAKWLTRTSLSEQAQKAYVQILARLQVLYERKVKPLIKEKASLVLIDGAVLEVIDEIYDDLMGTALEHDCSDIKGMLYFLTGNCFIEWKY